MGIYGALSTAVTGLRAQSHALENISGNIANSQTVGYKRIETSFKDLIADAPVKAQIPGAVLAQSQGTNGIQGDIQTSSNETYIALNANGFFVVEPKIGQSDGNPLFAGTNYFTRRGDFEIDKDGLLVNGAGYYLKGLPIDTATGNISGSVPDVIKISNAYLPANVTRLINYQANLPQIPKTANYNAATPNSELMKTWNYSGVTGTPKVPATTGVRISDFATSVPARAVGAVTYTGTANANTVVNNGDVLTVTVHGLTHNLRFDTTGNGQPLVSIDPTGTFAGTLTTPAQTRLNIPERYIAALSAGGGITIEGVTIPFTPATYAGLEDAIENHYGNGTSATYDVTTGQLTIVYPNDGLSRAADTVASGNERVINAQGNVTDMMAAVQSALHAATGDTSVVAELRHGAVVVSAGANSTADLTFATVRAGNGAVTGNLLGLANGPYEAVSGGQMTADKTPGYLAVSQGQTMEISIGGVVRKYVFDVNGSAAGGSGVTVINSNKTLDAMLADIQADLRLNGGPGAADARVAYSNDEVVISFDNNHLYDVSISGSAATSLGITGAGDDLNARTGSIGGVSADDAAQFISESISGGAITVYAENGSPANVQLRWAKVDSEATGGQDTWQLFYLSNSTATGGATAWTNTGQDYVFNANGSLVAPGVTEATISNLTVNGVQIGDVKLRHQENGVSQFADVNGSVSVSTLNQNGYGAGEFLSVAISDQGRVVATYSNGERLELAQVATAQFNGVNALKRLDGGVFQATAESGEPIIDLSGAGIIGGALEASNTDISDEFTKLIITQQAYSAGTRIVSAADEMLQEVLNMIR